MQGLIVALVVIACTAYAVWTLMPGAARRSLAGSMLKVVLLNGRQNGRRSGHQSGSESRLIVKLRKAAQATSGCACDGCDRAPKTVSHLASKTTPTANAGAFKVITFHPRVRR